MRTNFRAVRLELGRTVQQLRRARGWSQEQLAEAAGHSHKAIGQVERGETNFRIDTLIGIAAGLSIELADLCAPASRRGRRNRVVVVSQQDFELAQQLLRRFAGAARAPRRRSRNGQR